MPSRATRRGALALALACLCAGVLLPVASADALNAIQLENERPGTTAWELPGATRTTVASPSTAVQGYSSQLSVAPGEVLALHVSTTPAASYRVEVYRLGWYGGAGGRLITCLPSCLGSEPGLAQPVPSPDPNTGLLDAGWPVSDTVPVTSAWTSGYYLAKLVATSGPAAGQASEVPFIVRAPAGTHSSILVQASVNTWEAYNDFGGKSLYTSNSTGPTVPASKTVAAAMVSFNRPFAVNTNTTPLSFEYGLVRYLERRGYDVSYQTDVDTDLNAGSLLGHRLDVVNGHDEYWSTAMRNAWEAARGAGINEAFIGGNIGYWQARYTNSDRTLIEYRQAALDPQPDPALKTVPFSALKPPRPECSLLGVGYPGGLAAPGDPIRSFSVTPAAMANPWFRATGLTAGATITDSVGYEWDTLKPSCAPASARVLLHWTGSPQNADAVTYTAASGARVFSDGTMQLTWALDDIGHTPHVDGRVQALFANIFSDLGGAPPATAPPLPALLSPAPGHWVGSPATFTWNARMDGTETFSLVVDGQAAGSLDSSACSATECSLTARMRRGRHTWQVVATDPLAGISASPSQAFRVDTTPPAAFRPRAPANGATLWSPTPRLSWRAASDRGSGLSGYELVIDGKIAAVTRRTSYIPATALSEGRHSWRVIAVDRVGNRRASARRRLRVASARLASETRAAILRRGLVILDFCARGCRVRVIVGFARRPAALLTTRRFIAGGIERLALSLPRALRDAAVGRLRVTVVTGSGRAARSVTLSRPW
jgi:hypothetical protein